ncbi:MAG: hypothetical protein RL291_1437 [Pseudomonadota bacterium]|jgi:hypothetical protein
MATILQFPASQMREDRATRANEPREPGTTADVLLFTGVRYERHPEPLPTDLPPEPPAGRKKSSRKKLVTS